MTHHSSRKVRRFTVGGILLMLGFIGGLIPILQGWVFTVLALLILKNDITCARRSIVYIHRKFPNARPSIRAAEGKLDTWLEKLGLKDVS